MTELGLKRMPSRTECVRYFNNSCLASAISRKYGWYNLAKELNIPIKESETRFGKNYETTAAELLQSLGFEVQRMPQNFPYDLLIDNCIKVDVKASKLYRGKIGNFYTYNLEKPFVTCDFFILFAVTDSREIERTMIVPSCEVISNNQISVGEYKSKYHKYTDRYDLIENASLFWTNMQQTVVL
jgi:hypothetical protein